ncbi:DUF2971 domain-containing protein [Hymenobacter arizonensis]|uniref:DUF2971 domain-containing protein n=1 Tax=Hymenobacter arizonensis TaxID=1227077 RepID=A0A1I6BH62_HYMAR|nr:DUF2971 domain-containing protein [Hymenobacter arizonensis]SFQ80266.1 Protein of unknown function [Hymenobacter arizonensis]
MHPEAAKQYLTRRVQTGEFPRYLYKYRPLYVIDREHPEGFTLVDNTTKIITTAAMWHSEPTTFNDPFDCQIPLDSRRSADIVRSVAKLYERLESHRPRRRADRRRGLNNLRQHPKLTVERAQVWLRDTMAHIGICCYGTRGDNLLMWSHYADSHCGVCLKFDVLADPIAYFDMCPVTYSRDYPVLARLDEESVSKALSVKADVWAYEEECRVFTRSGQGSKSFAKKSLVEISIGAKAWSAPVEAFIDLLDSDADYEHVHLRQARVSNRSFSLEFTAY